ncbi:MAG: ABC-F type ribosomal protection protein [Lachnospiraceae bacterium]|nr:ABC-F type ribosomal protection protein [Lachnospiraceae bacterium]
MLLSCSHLTKSYGGNTIISDISFHINDYEKCAVVGINGAGKTTLLKILTGEESADSGDVFISSDRSVGYLKQQQDISSELTIYDEISSVKEDIFLLEQRLRGLESGMRGLSGTELEKMLEEYNRCTTLFERADGYACRSEIAGIIKGLGFDEDNFSKKINTLSGGQKTRVALGKILLSKPDLIILDEPTNHLDMNSIAWLENYIRNYNGAVLVVSHDRYFLDRTVTKIVELDNTKGTVFAGNYSDYSEKKAFLKASLQKAYENQQREIKHQEEVITKLRQFNREKSIKRAESREKMLDKIERIEKPFELNSEMKIRFHPGTESGKDVLAVSGLAKSFGDNHLFSGVSFEIKKGERLGIIGDNGTGKTTLLKIINELEHADAGQIKIGANVNIGYYDQEQQVLSDDKTVFSEVHDTYPNMTETEIRNLLAAFLFTGDDVFKMVCDLSGGERGRLSLAKLMLSESNFLILDEPTNHLDIVSKEILENALGNYTGTVLYVSHDRYFINKTATGILHLTERHIDRYIGNYDYFLEKYNEIKEKGTKDNTDNHETAIQPSESRDDWQKQKEEKARIKKIQNRIVQCENKISELESLIAGIDETIALPENMSNSGLLNSLTNDRDRYETQLETELNEWEKLSEQLEALS